MGIESLPSKRCPTCDAEVTDSDVVCPKCGTSLVPASPESGIESLPAKKCPTCGTWNPGEATVCIKCGYRWVD